MHCSSATSDMSKIASDSTTCTIKKDELDEQEVVRIDKIKKITIEDLKQHKILCHPKHGYLKLNMGNNDKLEELKEINFVKLDFGKPTDQIISIKESEIDTLQLEVQI